MITRRNVIAVFGAQEDGHQLLCSVCTKTSEAKEALIKNLMGERAALKAKILQLDDEIAAAKKAVSRASVYPMTWPRSKCPVCWLNNKDELVRAISGGTAQCDYYRCASCIEDFEVPFG